MTEAKPLRRVVVCRCPKCGSTRASADEARSRYDLTWMQCDGCGNGGFHDSWERDEWFDEIELPEGSEVPEYLAIVARRFGCDHCASSDAATAWTWTQKRRGRSFVQESHFGVHLTQCTCGQRFAVIFTERMNFAGDEDDQTWLVLPVTEAESKALEGPGITRKLTEMGQARRFLVRSGGDTWWRDGGLAIGRHD